MDTDTWICCRLKQRKAHCTECGRERPSRSVFADAEELAEHFEAEAEKDIRIAERHESKARETRNSHDLGSQVDSDDKYSPTWRDMVIAQEQSAQGFRKHGEKHARWAAIIRDLIELAK